MALTSPPHIASRTSRTFRVLTPVPTPVLTPVLTPWKYISAHATSNARSDRCHLPNRLGWYGSQPRTCGTDNSTSPTRALSVRGLCPLRRPTRDAVRSCGPAPGCAVTSCSTAARQIAASSAGNAPFSLKQPLDQRPVQTDTLARHRPPPDQRS